MGKLDENQGMPEFNGQKLATIWQQDSLSRVNHCPVTAEVAGSSPVDSGHFLCCCRRGSIPTEAVLHARALRSARNASSERNAIGFFRRSLSQRASSTSSARSRRALYSWMGNMTAVGFPFRVITSGSLRIFMLEGKFRRLRTVEKRNPNASVNEDDAHPSRLSRVRASFLPSPSCRKVPSGASAQSTGDIHRARTLPHDRRCPSGSGHTGL